MDHLCEFILSDGLVGFVVCKEKLVRIVDNVLGLLEIEDHQVNFRFVDEQEIAELNSKFRGVDASTDVLSFPLQEWESPLVAKGRSGHSDVHTSISIPGLSSLGDIAISLPNARINALKIGQPLDREVCFLIVHGILHLCGFDHKLQKDEKLMLARQRSIMGKLEESEPPQWHGCVTIEEAC